MVLGFRLRSPIYDSTTRYFILYFFCKPFNALYSRSSGSKSMVLVVTLYLGTWRHREPIKLYLSRHNFSNTRYSSSGVCTVVHILIKPCKLVSPGVSLLRSLTQGHGHGPRACSGPHEVVLLLSLDLSLRQTMPTYAPCSCRCSQKPTHRGMLNPFLPAHEASRGLAQRQPPRMVRSCALSRSSCKGPGENLPVEYIGHAMLSSAAAMTFNPLKNTCTAMVTFFDVNHRRAVLLWQQRTSEDCPDR